jgi:O-methyltransferase domain
VALVPKRRSRFVRKRSSVFEPASLSRKEHGLSGRVEFCPGDFFRHPFPAAEVVVIGRVLHNWDMTRKKLLLKKAFDALPAGGAGIIYKRLIDDERRHNAKALLSSLNMLVMTTGGFDFTAAGGFGWMREVGFRDIAVEPLTGD